MLLQTDEHADAEGEQRQAAEDDVGGDERVRAVFDGDAALGVGGVDGAEGFFEGAGGLDAGLEGEGERRREADAGCVGWGADGLVL